MILLAKDQSNKMLEIRVKERTLYLEEALKVKRNFLNNMSHEIRTPLQGILSISEELSSRWEEFDEHKRQQLAKMVSQNSDRLMRLVSNILDMSKLESGKMHYDMQQHDIVAIAKEVIAEFCNVIYDLSINMHIKNETHELFAYCDSIRVAQVIRNLVANAIKFGNGYDIDVEIFLDSFYCSKLKGEVKGVRVNVIDYGIGIPENELTIIFNPFVESSNTKSMAGGTGLGLSISKEIVEAHGGIIKASSSEHKTTLSFIIPSTHEKNVEINEKSVQSQLAHNKNLTILIIDDEEPCRIACTLMLNSAGHKIIDANGGTDGLNKLDLHHTTIDIILLDLMMPDIHGLDVLADIRRNKKFDHIPIIIQSGTTDKSEINASL
jgi:two-component system sensor histidine kinase ChiS